MAVAEARRESLRSGEVGSSWLVLALLISLIFHSSVVGTYELGKKLHWWEHFHWPSWIESLRQLAQVIPPPPPKASQPEQAQELPLVFLDVSPAQETTEAPKNAKFYSDRNSQAANLKADQETDTPKISGDQKQMAKTEDVPRQKFMPLQPSAPTPPQIQKNEQPEMKAKPSVKPGDLVMAKPELVPHPEQGKDESTRPRTLQEARMRQGDRRLPGEKMQQEGGVRRHLEISSLDAKATPFGAYDRMLIEAISQHWFGLLDARDYASDARGKVVLQFILHEDGRITDMNVAENSTSEVLSLICQRAVLDPAPFEPWPSDLRRMAGETRSIQFTFYYN